MKNRFLTQTPLLILLLYFCINGQLIADSNVTMLNLSFKHQIEDKGDTALFIKYHFDKKCRNYFYVIDQNEKSIIISFINAWLGGFLTGDTVITVNKGPVQSIKLEEHAEDKNKEIKGLKPDYYYLLTATLKCHRVPRNEKVITFSEKDDIVSLSLPWPSAELQRDSLYITPPRKKRKGLAAVMAGIGAATLAGGGVFLVTYLTGNEDPDAPIPVNLPVHPSIP